jgi:hypothetical protein
MLARTQALLLAAALLKNGIVLHLMEVEDVVSTRPMRSRSPLGASHASTN